MELFIIRHAIAVPRAAELEDAERPLTRRGIRRFERVVRGLSRLELRLDLALHSPWARAVQTAALLAPILDGPCRATPLLADDPDEGVIAELAAQATTATRAALVGHEPWMGELASLLVTGTVAHGERFPFRKGGVAWLEGEVRPGGMAVRALMPPRVLRAVTRA
jgi:phosphohistidine phosphatase